MLLFLKKIKISECLYGHFNLKMEEKATFLAYHTLLLQEMIEMQLKCKTNLWSVWKCGD